MSRIKSYEEDRILFAIFTLTHCLRVPEAMLTGGKS